MRLPALLLALDSMTIVFKQDWLAIFGAYKSSPIFPLHKSCLSDGKCRKHACVRTPTLRILHTDSGCDAQIVLGLFQDDVHCTIDFWQILAWCYRAQCTWNKLTKKTNQQWKRTGKVGVCVTQGITASGSDGCEPWLAVISLLCMLFEKSQLSIVTDIYMHGWLHNYSAKWEGKVVIKSMQLINLILRHQTICNISLGTRLTVHHVHRIVSLWDKDEQKISPHSKVLT